VLVLPLIHRGLGPEPRGTLEIIDLPENDDTPFEDGGVLFTAVQHTEPEKLTGVMVHSLSHLYFQSPYAWLQEGVPSFMGSLWVEQKQGRDTAIQQLDNERATLSLAEPGETLSDDVARQALSSARDPVYFRTKATYVLWMLRDLAGDDALTRALRGYQSATDSGGTGFEEALQHATNKDLKWFFDDWVYHDRGLPDLSIAGIYPNKASLPGAYIVSVDVANSGTAEAQVPVSVSSATATVTENLRIPARSQVSHRFLVQGRPTEVAVNDGTVPEVEASVHRKAVSFTTPEPPPVASP
jgi:aminopeptidase N